MISFLKIFGYRLKNIRKSKGLTQADASAILGIPVSTYANWEQGRREPGVWEIYKIIFAFKINANDLFGVVSAFEYKGVSEDVTTSN